VTTFALVPGAGGNASYWNRLVGELECRGHHAIAVDLPGDDPELGLTDWAALVDRAIAGETGVVLVAQSLAGFLVPLVREPVDLLVLLNAMIPAPGESPDAWWGNTGSGEARRSADEAAGRDPEFDVERHFLHDLDDEARAVLFAERPREPSDTAMAEKCDYLAWPNVPTRVLVGRDDRFFPVDFQRRIARERLGLEIDEIPGGHLVAVANPALVAKRLISYVR
jgi:pimeloyl-ACP methyl ester carboxylesterase